MAIMPGQNRSRFVEVQHRVEQSQRVIFGDVILKPELVKQLFRRILLSHHGPFLRCYSGETESEVTAYFNEFLAISVSVQHVLYP